MLSDVSGSRKSKIATAKPEMRVYQLVGMIESQFQRLSRMANSMALRRMSKEVENPRWPPLYLKFSFKFKTLLSERVVVLQPGIRFV